MAELYKNAKRILVNSEARIAQSASGIYDLNLVILFWENVEAKHINECVEYLNLYPDQSVVASPVQFYDISFTEDLYHLHAYYDEKDQRIYRLLMRDPITYAEDNFSQTTSKWKLLGGKTYTSSGQTTAILMLRNVDPETALSFQSQVLDESYTNAIYLLRAIRMDGKWYSIKRESEEDPKTGLFTLRWYLSLNNNKDFYFSFQADPYTRRGILHISDTTEAQLDTFIKERLFAADGTLLPETTP